jgi:hypothetical protein
MKKLIALILCIFARRAALADGTPMPVSAAFYFNVTTAASGGTFGNADSAPTWTLLKNGNTVITTGTFTVAGTGTLAGNYYGSLTLNSASFAVSDTYALEATGTISAVPVKVIVQQGRVLPAEITSGFALVSAGGGTITGISGGTINVTGIVNSGTLSNAGTVTVGTLALTNASTLSNLTVGTASNVTNRVTTGGGTIDLANAVGTLAASQSFNNVGQTTATPADVTKYNGTATKWGSNAPGDLHTGTAQGSGDPSEIILAAGASATNDLYLGNVISIISGTGAGQSRVISDYTGSSKVAAVGRAWVTQPDNTSVYAVRSDISPSISDTLGVNVSYWNGGAVESYATAANLATLTGYVDTEVAAIKTKTDQLTFTTANRLDSTVIDKTGFSLTVTPPTAAAIRTEMDANSTKLTSIKTVTDALNTSLELDGLVYRFTTNALEQAPAPPHFLDLNINAAGAVRTQGAR